MVIRRSRPIERAALLLIAASLIAICGVLMTPRPVGACSCVPLGTMKDYAKPENAVFTGTAGVREARGVPVAVDRWMWGVGAAPIVWLTASSFGDSAACGVEPPPPGTAWIWVAWRPEQGDFATGLCSPAANLATGEGRAMLADAESVFKAVPPPEPAPTAGGGNAPTAAPDPMAAARDLTGLAIGAFLVAMTVAMFGGLALIARRSGGPR